MRDDNAKSGLVMAGVSTSIWLDSLGLHFTWNEVESIAGLRECGILAYKSGS